MNKLIIPSKTERLLEKNPFLLTRGHDFVEIGGVKWATCNIGAKCPTDYGIYFQWGDIQGYTTEQVRNGEKHFNWESHLFNNHSIMSPLNKYKYNLTDGKTVLDLEDDAAHVNLGGVWRMPTKEEIKVLGITTNRVWTTDYKDSGIAGLVCIDKTDSSKELFLPAAGRCIGRAIADVRYFGFYWSSSVYDSSNVVYSICHFKYCQSLRYLDYCYHGFPIRGVLGI